MSTRCMSCSLVWLPITKAEAACRMRQGMFGITLTCSSAYVLACSRPKAVLLSRSQ